MGGPPLEFIDMQPQKRGSPLEVINIQPPKMGSASRIHQHTAPQKGVRFQNSSTYSTPKGGSPLEFINIQPPKRGPPLEFINQRGSTSRFHQPKRDPINQKRGPPLGTISMDLAIFNQQSNLSKYSKQVPVLVSQARVPKIFSDPKTKMQSVKVILPLNGSVFLGRSK